MAGVEIESKILKVEASGEIRDLIWDVEKREQSTMITRILFSTHGKMDLSLNPFVEGLWEKEDQGGRSGAQFLTCSFSTSNSGKNVEQEVVFKDLEFRAEG